MPNAVTRSIAIAGCLALALQGCAGPGPGEASYSPETRPVREAGENRKGAELHPRILAQFGGAYENRALQAYVEDIGRRLAAVSEQPDAPWTFTVLDSPSINAFALPGGYVYVTRGLVALARDEAELAGVVGHEIGHVTAGHSGLREDRGQLASLGLLLGGIGLAAAGVDPNLARGAMQIGQTAAGGVLASYSRGDELAADSLGVRYLARAGYDPYAQADFLDRMSRSSALQAEIAGRGYDPNRVDFLASHPATAQRTRQAIETARRTGEISIEGGERGREAFLDVIDGIAWGDSASQGFVRDGRFVHPELRFAFDVPRGFTIRNTSRAVIAQGPGRARFIFDGGQDPGGSLRDYILRRWVPSLAEQTRVGRPQVTDRRSVDGLEAAEVILPVSLDGAPHVAVLTAIRRDGRIYRMTGIARRGSAEIGTLRAAAGSFESLTAGQAARYQPLRVDVVTVRQGQTVADLVARMETGDGYAEERFRLMNDIGPGEGLRAGEQVKIVR